MQVNLDGAVTDAKHARNFPVEKAVCVILDINLNDGSGIEVRHRLKAANIFVPVIYITGRQPRRSHGCASMRGASPIFTKPFSAKSLMEPLQRVSTGLT